MHDLFATKGTEYVITIVYLLLMVAALTLVPRRGQRAPARAAQPVGAAVGRALWFALADGYHYHQGHSWAAPADGDLVTVGLDDFAAQAVGAPDAVVLPGVGDTLVQGGPGWRVRASDRSLAMLAPVGGEVVAVNPAVLASPQLAGEDPYGAGWLLKVRAPNRQAALKNLFSGDLAGAWMRNTIERLRAVPAGGLGVVMPDGGTPVRGFARALDQSEWDLLAREFFLTG
jgi:glycine cleavage system H protein